MSERPHGKLWMAIRLAEVRLRFVAVMIVTGLVVANWEGIQNRIDRWTRPAPKKAGALSIEFYCPMHPHFIRDEPGNCSICGMPLSQRLKGEKAVLPEGVLSRISLTPTRVAMAGVIASAVGYEKLERQIRAEGIVHEDPRLVCHPSARVPGRIEQVMVNVAGTEVKAGQVLATLYSPDLVNAQEEYLQALRSGRGSPSEASRRAASDARERLARWDVAKEDLEELERRDQPLLQVPIRSPRDGVLMQEGIVHGHYVAEGEMLFSIVDLSRVFVAAHVFESDLAAVHIGQEVEVRGRALQNQALAGRISLVGPSVDPVTRTVEVRVEVPNPERRLLPGMYVDVALRSSVQGIHPPEGLEAAPKTPRYFCTMRCEGDKTYDAPGKCPVCEMKLKPVEVVATSPADAVLAVPESAVIDTGIRKAVYVESDAGVYDAVEVVLGPRAGRFYPVLAGLKAGDRVVTGGAFLVDAETRLNPAASAAYFGASGTPSDKSKDAGGGR